MKSPSRLTLETKEDETLLAKLEYTSPSGEKIVMETTLQKQNPGAPQRTLLDVEKAILQRTADVCNHLLKGMRTES